MSPTSVILPECVKNPFPCQHAAKATQAARVLPKPESRHKRQPVTCTTTGTSIWRTSLNSPIGFLVESPIKLFTFVSLPNPCSWGLILGDFTKLLSLLPSQPLPLHKQRLPFLLHPCAYLGNQDAGSQGRIPSNLLVSSFPWLATGKSTCAQTSAWIRSQFTHQHQLCMELKISFDSVPFVKQHFTLKTIRSAKKM